MRSLPVLVGAFPEAAFHLGQGTKGLAVIDPHDMIEADRIQGPVFRQRCPLIGGTIALPDLAQRDQSLPVGVAELKRFALPEQFFHLFQTRAGILVVMGLAAQDIVLEMMDEAAIAKSLIQGLERITGLHDLILMEMPGHIQSLGRTPDQGAIYQRSNRANHKNNFKNSKLWLG